MSACFASCFAPADNDVVSSAKPQDAGEWAGCVAPLRVVDVPGMGRGLVAAELEAASRAAWRAQQDGLPSAATDLYRCAASVYRRVRSQLQEALNGEFAKLELIERTKLASGRL